MPIYIRMRKGKFELNRCSIWFNTDKAALWTPGSGVEVELPVGLKIRASSVKPKVSFV